MTPSWRTSGPVHVRPRALAAGPYPFGRPDAYVRSAHFHEDRDTKIFAGPLWDFDFTFGVGGLFQNDQIAGRQYRQTRQPPANDWFPHPDVAVPGALDRLRPFPATPSTGPGNQS
ncbi:hypothetical protein AB0G15_36705 [Streptosporangium sp. NPDC023825]|uniref:hypothetical protein n=1 Tax=Streptosporangium sp. NPDC023825 TaxID=3154909 RepID=UPI003420DB8C